MIDAEKDKTRTNQDNEPKMSVLDRIEIQSYLRELLGKSLYAEVVEGWNNPDYIVE